MDLREARAGIARYINFYEALARARDVYADALAEDQHVGHGMTMPRQQLGPRSVKSVAGPSCNALNQARL